MRAACDLSAIELRISFVVSSISAGQISFVIPLYLFSKSKKQPSGGIISTIGSTSGFHDSSCRIDTVNSLPSRYFSYITGTSINSSSSAYL
jgi:hypothetical protein